MVGKDDWVCVPANYKVMETQIKDSTLKIFNKCGHALTTDANEKYIKSVKQFLQNERRGK
jgi:pimeloyl-ACP methyl ester carboxylesterase